MSAAQRDPLAGKRFLVADDHAFARRALCEMLCAHGAAAAEAEDGEAAVRLFADAPEGTFDAAILDVCMPGIDGYAAALSIRQMGRRDARQMPIFAHSGAEPQYARRQAMESGMDACLQKPVAMRELARLMQAVRGKP